MSYSTLTRTRWEQAVSQVMLVTTPADIEVDHTFYVEEYVSILHPHELDLLRPIKVTIERDDEGFVVSDDFSDVYGEGDTHNEAIANYRHALTGLERVLGAREANLSPELALRLAM